MWNKYTHTHTHTHTHIYIHTVLYIYIYIYIHTHTHSTELPHNPAIPLIGIYPRELGARVHTKKLYLNVHSSIIHNSQQVETLQMSINRWTDKGNVVQPYNEIWLTTKGNEVSHMLQHRWTLKTLCWSELQDTNGHILYDSIYRKCPE